MNLIKRCKKYKNTIYIIGLLLLILILILISGIKDVEHFDKKNKDVDCSEIIEWYAINMKDAINDEMGGVQSKNQYLNKLQHFNYNSVPTSNSDHDPNGECLSQENNFLNLAKKVLPTNSNKVTDSDTAQLRVECNMQKALCETGLTQYCNPNPSC